MVETPEEAAQVAAMSEGSITLAQQLLNAGSAGAAGNGRAQLEHLEQMKPLEDFETRVRSTGKNLVRHRGQRRNARWLLAIYRGIPQRSPETPDIRRLFRSVAAAVWSPLRSRSSCTAPGSRDPCRLIRSKEIRPCDWFLKRCSTTLPASCVLVRGSAR